MTHIHLPALSQGDLARSHLLPITCGARKKLDLNLGFLTAIVLLLFPLHVLSMLYYHMDCGFRFRSCWKVFWLPSRNTNFFYLNLFMHLLRVFSLAAS